MQSFSRCQIVPDSARRHSTNSNKPEKASVDLCISENLLSNRENPLDGPSSVSKSSTAASAVSKPRYQHRVGESADMLPPATVDEQQIEQDDPLDVDPMDDGMEEFVPNYATYVIPRRNETTPVHFDHVTRIVIWE
jgi:hypothetical protein